MTKPVLVVEKDKHLANLVSSILSGRDFEVKAFTSASDTLTELKSAEPKLIVVGEVLSDIDGIGFIAKVRSDYPRVQIVFVANQWRDESFYLALREDLKVSLVVHRPLRSSVFTIQLLGLLGVQNQQSEAGELELPVPVLDTAISIPNTGSEFARLRSRFVKSIPERLGKLQSFLNSTSNGSLSPQLIESAITVAHNLKGTSLSWGFEDLGNASGLMEKELKSAAGAGSDSRGWKRCFEIFQAMQTQADLISKEFNSSETTQDDFGEDKDTSSAKVLIVSEEPPPPTSGRSESGIQLDLIHVNNEQAIEKAGQVLLDAALIEIGPQSAALSLARKLRDLSGYENLPLGFISSPEASDARAEATHAGSSVFLAKPLESEIVQKVINQLISMREGGRFRVLVVDDDVDLANLTSRCLGQFGMLTRIVNDPLLVNSALQEFSPDLILLDVNMPGMSGFEVCRALRNTSRWRDVPILFLTAQTDLNSRLTAYEAGADDYLPKPVINIELLTRVKVRLERARELKERSERDLLTGLLLRRAFSDQADALIAECERHGFHFSLCLMDVDHFKKVNDTYGHHAGDEVLSTLGKLLRKRFRVEDLRGRWGGEEFILAFKHERKEVMQIALQRVMEELKQIEFKGEQGESFYVSFSAGLSSYPTEGKSLQTLAKVADRRLYLAKERGRKQIVIDD